MIGQLDLALADCNEARRLQPHLTGHNRAAVYLKLGRFDEAIADYDAILKSMPRESIAIYGRGLAKLKKGDAAAGDADITAAKAINPNIAGAFAAWYGIGEPP